MGVLYLDNEPVGGGSTPSLMARNKNIIPFPYYSMGYINNPLSMAGILYRIGSVDGEIILSGTVQSTTTPMTSYNITPPITSGGIKLDPGIYTISGIPKDVTGVSLVACTHINTKIAVAKEGVAASFIITEETNVAIYIEVEEGAVFTSPKSTIKPKLEASPYATNWVPASKSDVQLIPLGSITISSSSAASVDLIIEGIDKLKAICTRGNMYGTAQYAGDFLPLPPVKASSINYYLNTRVGTSSNTLKIVFYPNENRIKVNQLNTTDISSSLVISLYGIV